MWMEILIAYHVCISEWVNSWLCLAPYLCRSAVPKNALLCAVFPKRERCMCTQVIRYSFLKWNTCVPFALEFESGTKIYFETFFSFTLSTYNILGWCKFLFGYKLRKVCQNIFFLRALVIRSVFIFLYFFFPPKEYFEKKERNVSQRKSSLKSIAFL